MSFRVIVAGDRRLTDYDIVCERLDHLLSGQTDVTILSGAADGADALGERYAALHGHACERYPADWKQHGRKAGPIRNCEMAQKAEACVAFDGGGPGTRHMIGEARRLGLVVRVVDVRHLVATP